VVIKKLYAEIPIDPLLNNDKSAYDSEIKSCVYIAKDNINMFIEQAEKKHNCKCLNRSFEHYTKPGQWDHGAGKINCDIITVLCEAEFDKDFNQYEL
jgi:hypothetical protein